MDNLGLASCSISTARLRRSVSFERGRPARVPREPNRQWSSLPGRASDARLEVDPLAFRDVSKRRPCEPISCVALSDPSERPDTRRTTDPRHSPSVTSVTTYSVATTNQLSCRPHRAAPRSGRSGLTPLRSRLRGLRPEDNCTVCGERSVLPPRGPNIAANSRRTGEGFAELFENRRRSPSRVAHR